MSYGNGSTPRRHRVRRAATTAVFGVILVGGLTEPAVAGFAETRGPGGPRSVTIGTNHAKVEAFAYDGEDNDPPPTQTQETSDVSAFTAEVEATDEANDVDTPGRSALGFADQETTVDTSSPFVTDVESFGRALARWTDGTAGDSSIPEAHSTSELTLTFEVVGNPEFFSLSGFLSAEARNTLQCTTITVTSPSGTTLDVAAPSGCGAPADLNVEEHGKLQPGTYTFSVVANAQGRNPDALDGFTQATFHLHLVIGCSIVGTADDDFLPGTPEDDAICGLGGEDILEGAGGDDVLFGGRGSDRIVGNDGDDVILGEGGSDKPFGDRDDLGLFGGAGDDTIDGGEGSDAIFGGTGNDVLSGGESADLIVGDDSLGCDGALADPGLDDDQLFGGGEGDILSGCQGLDKIHGEGGDDEIFGNTGNDVLLGDAGSDKLHGNGGPDRLTGGERKDVLLGNGGNDTLLAADGVLDEVHGGPGGGDEAKIDEDVDLVDGVEVFL